VSQDALVLDEPIIIDADKRPPGVELVPLVGLAPGTIAVRPLSQAEGFRRIALRAQVAQPSPETIEANAKRAAAEADVVAAARRSQAEIRRHVDAYLKEHLEPIVADVVKAVAERTTETTMRGLAGLAESQQIALDKMAADVRRGLEAFARGAYGKPKAKRAWKGARR